MSFEEKVTDVLLLLADLPSGMVVLTPHLLLPFADHESGMGRTAGSDGKGRWAR
jgi:hypothetical protein